MKLGLSKNKIVDAWLHDDGTSRDCVELANNLGIEVGSSNFSVVKNFNENFNRVLAVFGVLEKERVIVINEKFLYGDIPVFIVAYFIAQYVLNDVQVSVFKIEELDFDAYLLAQTIFLRSQKYKDDSKFTNKDNSNFIKKKKF